MRSHKSNQNAVCNLFKLPFTRLVHFDRRGFADEFVRHRNSQISDASRIHQEHRQTPTPSSVK